MAFDLDETEVPARHSTDLFLLRPLRETDAVLDHAAVMESRVQLRTWELSTWPEDDFTVEANREDLARHERLHVEGRAFTYTVMDPTATECLGCVYLFPTDAPFLAAAQVAPVGDARWDDVEAAVYYWVRTSGSATMDRALLDTLRVWLEDDWPIDDYVFVTSERFTQQVDVIEGTDLELRFEIAEPDKSGRYLAYR